MTTAATVLVGVLVLLAASVALFVYCRTSTSRQRQAAQALYAEVQLQRLTHAAAAAMLNEARRAVSHPDGSRS